MRNAFFSTPHHLLTPLLVFSILFQPFSINATFAQSATSERCITKVGDPDPTTSPSPGPLGCSKQVGSSGPCQEPPQTYSTKEEYLREFQATWEFEIWGDIPVQQLEWIWEEFWAVNCTGFLQSLSGTQIKGYYRGDLVSYQNPADACPGDQIDPQEEPNVYFNNGLSEMATKVLIIHELTHVWQTCADNGKTNRGGIEDAIAQDRGKLTTYSRNECPGIPVAGVDENGNPWDNSLNEDHSETITYYLNPDADEVTCSSANKQNPYKAGEFPGHYSLAESGVGKRL